MLCKRESWKRICFNFSFSIWLWLEEQRTWWRVLLSSLVKFVSKLPSKLWIIFLLTLWRVSDFFLSQSCFFSTFSLCHRRFNWRSVCCLKLPNNLCFYAQKREASLRQNCVKMVTSRSSWYLMATYQISTNVTCPLDTFSNWYMSRISYVSS